MSLSQFLDDKFRNHPPSVIIYSTAASLLIAKLGCDFFAGGRLLERLDQFKHEIIRFVAFPVIRVKLRKVAEGLKMPSKEGEFKSKTLPENGLEEGQVLSLLNDFHETLDISYKDGGFSGAVYHGGEAYTDFINKVMSLFQWSNPLHTDAFGATRKMEAEVVSMVVNMYNGHLLPDACGALTSGGTESILMAMKVYRDWGRAEKGIENPSIVVGTTAHPAFDKAAEYFNIDIIKVSVDPTTFQINPKEMEKYIKFNTVAIVGSAPSFPHGIIDPIEELSELAYRYDIGFHVDCCLGGFILPFLSATGRGTPIFDFRNRGVTTISCDTHKYGFAPKGTSTVLYRTKALRSYQFCCISKWPGGLYCSPAVSGSKPGNVIAGAWAAMVHTGLNGYIDSCDKIVSAREYMTNCIRKLPYLHILGNPIASVFAFTSNYFDIFLFGDELTKRGWLLNRLQFPSGLQFSVTLLQTNANVKERFVQDVEEIGDRMYKEYQDNINAGKSVLKGEAGPSFYGSAQRVKDSRLVKDVLKEFLSIYYSA